VPRLRTIFTIHWPLIVKVMELGFGISKLKKTLPLLLNAAPDNASGKNDTFCVTSPRWPLTSFNDHGPLMLRISCESNWKSVSETPLPEIGPEQPKSADISYSTANLKRYRCGARRRAYPQHVRSNKPVVRLCVCCHGRLPL